MGIPSHLLKSLISNNTSLGQHPCFPPDDELCFLEKIVTPIYEIFTKKNIDKENVKDELSKLVKQAKNIEINNIETLQKLCADIVKNIFNLEDLEETMEFDLKLTNSVDNSNIRMLPEKTEEYNFDSINEIEFLTKEIYKKRMLNALITGAAMYYSNNISSYIKELFDVDNELPSLYKKIVDYNNHLLFNEPFDYKTMENNISGKVTVVINKNENTTTLTSEAILFPVLLEETIKGVLEKAISNGLPSDYTKAKYIISKSDFKLAEYWDTILGYCLWVIIHDGLIKNNIDIIDLGLYNFFSYVSQIDVDDFNLNLKEVFAKTKHGLQFLKDISFNIEENNFINYSNKKNAEIKNSFYNSEELLSEIKDGDF